MSNASIFVVLVIAMHSSRNSSSRPLYSVVNSVVHPMIHCAVCMKLVGLFFVQFIKAFLNALTICNQNASRARRSGNKAQK